MDEGQWALEALKKFPIDGALSILNEFMDSRLNHISEQGTHLCKTMRKHQSTVNAKKIEVCTLCYVFFCFFSVNSYRFMLTLFHFLFQNILEGTGYTLHAKFGLRKSVGPSNCDRSSECEVRFLKYV